MEQENDNEDVDTEDDTEDTTESIQETKPKETPEQRHARLSRQLKQLEKKMGMTQADKPEAKSDTPSQSNELTDGQLALLRADGIRKKAEVELVRQMMAQTGKSLLDVLDNKYFKAELQELRDADAVQEATPSSTRRGQATRDSMDYHLAEYARTGNLPADRATAEKVLEARLNQEKSKNEFTDTPVIMPGYTNRR